MWRLWCATEGDRKKNFEVLTFDTFFLRIFAIVKVTEAIEHFANYVSNERRMAAGTTKYYVGVTNSFASYLQLHGIDEVEGITAAMVRDWQLEQTLKGQRPGTMVKKMAALRAWFKYLRMYEGFERDIMAKITPPKRPKRLPVYFREKEAETIYSGQFPDTFDGETERLVLRMLYETGLRRSELASLTPGSIDLQARYIKVRGKGNKDRVVPIELELANNISRYLTLREEMMTQIHALQPDRELPAKLLITSKGKAVTGDVIYAIVERYMHPVSNADRTSPHVFRHTFATHMLNEGADISAIKELLGHSSLASTEIYTHVSREYLKETYKHAHPRAHKK